MSSQEASKSLEENDKNQDNGAAGEDEPAVSLADLSESTSAFERCIFTECTNINRLSPEVKKTENVVTMQQNMAVCSKLKNDFGAKLATISHLQEQIGLRVQEFKEGIERYAENAKEDVQDVDKIDAALDQKLKVRLEQVKDENERKRNKLALLRTGIAEKKEILRDREERQAKLKLKRQEFEKTKLIQQNVLNNKSEQLLAKQNRLENVRAKTQEVMTKHATAMEALNKEEKELEDKYSKEQTELKETLEARIKWNNQKLEDIKAEDLKTLERKQTELDNKKQALEQMKQDLVYQNAENQNLAKENKELANELAKAKEEAVKVKSELETVINFTKQLEASLTEIRALEEDVANNDEVGAFNRFTVEHQEFLRNSKSKLDQLEHETEFLTGTQDEVQAMIAKQKGLEATEFEMLQQLEVAVAEMKTTLESLNKQMEVESETMPLDSSAETEELVNKINELKAANEEMEREIEKLKAEAERAKRNVQEISSDRELDRKELDEIVKSLLRDAEENADESLGKSNKLMEEVETWENELEVKQKESEERERKIQSLREKILELQQKPKDQKKNDELSKPSTPAKSILNKSFEAEESKKEKAVAKKVTFRKKLESPLATQEDSSNKVDEVEPPVAARKVKAEKTTPKKKSLKK